MVTRRFTDFDWLHERLSLLPQLEAASLLPRMPKKKSWGRSEREFVEARREHLQRMMSVIMSHHLLWDNLFVHIFLNPTVRSHLPRSSKKKKSHLSQLWWW